MRTHTPTRVTRGPHVDAWHYLVVGSPVRCSRSSVSLVSITAPESLLQQDDNRKIFEETRPASCNNLKGLNCDR